METDNLYPNDGAVYLGAFTEPEAQKTAKAETQRAVEQAAPMIKKMIEHLETRIAFYSSVDSIPGEVIDSPNTEAVRIKLSANKQTKTDLNEELNTLKAILTEFTN